MVSVKRPEVANRIHDAKEHGDLSENAEYEDAKNEQAFVEGRIQTLEALIKNATIIDENHSTDHVQIGSTVDGREPRRQGSLHDRRLGRGQAGRGPHLEREPGRARPARQEEGREGRRQGPRRRLHLQDRRHQLERRRAHGLGGRTRRPGSAARRSSTTRRRRPGRSTSAACAVRSSSTSITRALRANGLETTLLYGVDDLDPMDAQALLTPDAIEREMGRPLAHVPDPREASLPGDRRIFGGGRAKPRAQVHRPAAPPAHPDPARPVGLHDRVRACPARRPVRHEPRRAHHRRAARRVPPRARPRQAAVRAVSSTT